jgi:hypothetical protein
MLILSPFSRYFAKFAGDIEDGANINVEELLP